MPVLDRLRHAHGGKRLLHAVDDGTRERDERPDGGDPHGARADETHALLVDCGGELLHRHTIRRRSRNRVERHETRPRDEDADEHGETARDADEVARTDERRRVADRKLRHAAPERNPNRKGAREYLEAARAERDDAGDETARQDLLESRAFILGALAMLVDLQDFCRRNALGIGEIAVNHHGTAQRNREKHSQTAAARSDQERLHELEAMPITDHEHARYDEDDCRQGAGGRGLRLHHIVFQNIGILRHLEDSHGNDSRRYGRREGQADLQPQIDVRCRKDHGQYGAQEHAAHGKLGQSQLMLHKLVVFIFHSIAPHNDLRPMKQADTCLSIIAHIYRTSSKIYMRIAKTRQLTPPSLSYKNAAPS